MLFPAEGDNYPSLPVIVTNEPEEAREGEPAPAAADAAAAGAGAAPEPAEVPVADLIKSLVHFLANRPTHMPLWQYEDITAKGNLEELTMVNSDKNVFVCN